MPVIDIAGAKYEIEVEAIQLSPMANIYSDFRGWMSPDGELSPLYGVDGHTRLAKEILGYTPDNPIEALHGEGWIRVVCENSYSCKKLDENTRRLLLGIVLKRRDNMTFFVEIGKESLRLSRDEAIEYFGSPILE